MVRKFQSLPAEQREHMRGGDGTVTLTPGLQAGDYAAELRLFSRITLPAGASIGTHVHQDEEEFSISSPARGNLTTTARRLLSGRGTPPSPAAANAIPSATPATPRSSCWRSSPRCNLICL